MAADWRYRAAMRRLLVLLFTLTLAFSACGGGDGNADDVAARSSTTEAGAGASDEDEEEAEAEDSDVAEFSGDDSGDFCDKAREYDKKFENIGENSDDAEAEWNELEDAIEDIAGDAPAEIRADVKLVAKNFKEVKALYAKYDYDFSKVPEEEASAIDNTGVDEATERVNSYMETVCDIDQDGDGDTDGVEPGSDETDTREFEEEEPPADE